MSIDSTTDLLFHIGADSDDAEENIQRFRALLGKDLDDIGAEFGEWREKVLGDLSTVSGAMTAVGSVFGAAVLAMGAASVEAADKYAEYVGEVARGSKTTGIAVEHMSALKFAAHETGTSYDALTTGLTRFASTVAKANEGGAEQQQMFQRLGISQAQVKAGEKDLMPLLLAVSDRFADMGSKVQRTAAARDLFSRGGAELVTLLGLGSEGIRKFAEEAQKMGLILGKQDTDALKEYRSALNLAKAEQEALDIEWGRATLPLMEKMELTWVSLIETIKTGHYSNVVDFAASMGVNFANAKAQVEATAKALGRLGDGKGIDKASKQIKEATADYWGLSTALESIRTRMHSSDDDMSKAASEIEHLRFEVGKVTEEYRKLAAEGKLTGEAAKREAAALGALPKAISDLSAHMMGDASSKMLAEMTSFGDEVRRKLLSQQEQTLQVRAAEWSLEIEGLRKHLAEMKTSIVGGREELSAAIDALSRAGMEKLGRDEADAVQKAGEDIERRIAEQGEKSYTQQIALWNRDVDALRESLDQKKQLTAANAALIDQLQRVGVDRIARDRQAEFTREITELQNHLSGMLSAYMTHEEKLRAQYQKDLTAFGAAEEAKVRLAAVGAEKQAAVTTQFAAIRAEITRRYELDLQQLQNSQGWQGVFGSHFESMLKHNEALLKQWATSTNQSMLMVKVTMEGLKEMSQQTFESFAQGMGSAIAQAIVYQKSIGAAMEAALKSTLESLAARALTEGIFAAGMGFLDLAEGDFAGAASAFQAAAIFGTVGAASAVAGMAIPSGAAGGGASGAASGGSGSGQYSGAATGTTATPAAGPVVHVVVNGHIFGINGVEALAGAINDAVCNRDVTLTATNTKTTQVVNR